MAGEAIPPAWRVIWSNYRNFHDWVGRAPAGKSGIIYRKRTRRLPPRHTQDFATREEAEAFRDALRRDAEDEMVAQIIALPVPRQWPPVDLLLPGPWPYRRRGDEP